MATMYAIHATARSRHNRLERSQLPQRPRMKQYMDFGQGPVRIIRGRPQFIPEEVLVKNIDLLRRLSKQQAIQVTTADGRVVNIETLEISPRAPAAQTTPSRRPDSIKDDKQWGIRMAPQFGDDVSDDGERLPDGHVPVLLRNVEREKQAQEPEDFDVEVDSEAPSVPMNREEPPPQEEKVASEDFTEDAELEAALRSAEEEAEEDDEEEDEGDEPEETTEEAHKEVPPTGGQPAQPPRRNKKKRKKKNQQGG